VDLLGRKYLINKERPGEDVIRQRSRQFIDSSGVNGLDGHSSPSLTALVGELFFFPIADAYLIAMLGPISSVCIYSTFYIVLHVHTYIYVNAHLRH
jgi:hypothetical protein